MRHLLLIEDSLEYQMIVQASLSGRFAVSCAVNAFEARDLLSRMTFDIILIDVGLPGQDGLSLCQELRQDPKLQSTPILFVTGKSDAKDVVLGFEMGGDDYIHKPFHPDELRVRIEARLKKLTVAVASAHELDHFSKSDLKFHVGRNQVSQQVGETERELDLTPNEFKILYLLVRNEGRTLSRAEILREVWGERLHVVERTVDKHVCSLRKKMGTTSPYVASIPGAGYQFRVPAASERVSAAGR